MCPGVQGLSLTLLCVCPGTVLRPQKHRFEEKWSKSAECYVWSQNNTDSLFKKKNDLLLFFQYVLASLLVSFNIQIFKKLQLSFAIGYPKSVFSTV